MPKVSLTDAVVTRYKAKPGDRIDYFDTLLGHGFALRVSGPTPHNPDGRKSRVLFYHFNGALKRMTIKPGYPALDSRKHAIRRGPRCNRLQRGETRRPASGRRRPPASARRRAPGRSTLAGRADKRRPRSCSAVVAACARDPADCPRCSSHVFTTWRRRGTGAGAGDEPISGFSKAKARLDAKVAEIAATVEAERVAPWRLHNLRRTAATIMGRLRVSRFALGRLLNHADGSVTGIYDRHEYLDEKRQALEAWSRFLENLISSPGANVTPLRRTA